MSGTNNQTGSEEVFASAVRNRTVLAPDQFFATLGWEDDEAERASRGASDAEVCRMIREHMQNTGGIHTIKDFAGPEIDRAARMLAQGQIAAVDGTDAISLTDLTTYSTYAVATGWVTRLVRGDSTISITKTSSTYVTPDAIKGNPDLLQKLEDEHDRGRNSESWPRTFRENEERLTALERCPAACVLLDGPIVTQNLLTQRLGIATLDRLFNSNKIFIGFIKEISGAMASTKWTGRSLLAGEVWVVGSLRDSMSRGARREAASQNIPDDYVRAVFRPNQRTFALECRRVDIPLALAIALIDQSPMPNHEIPMLLETIDAQLRSSFAGNQVRDTLLHRIMLEEGYAIGVNAMNERTFR